MAIPARMLVVSLSVLCAYSCSAPQPKKPEATVGTARVRRQVTPPDASNPLEMTLALFDRAWDAVDSKDFDEARRLTRKAVATLDEESIDNVNRPRVQLLLDLSTFCYRLQMQSLAMDVWKRADNASRTLLAMNVQRYETGRKPSTAAPKFESVASAQVERKDLDHYRPGSDPTRSKEDDRAIETQEENKEGEARKVVQASTQLNAGTDAKKSDRTGDSKSTATRRNDEGEVHTASVPEEAAAPGKTAFPTNPAANESESMTRQLRLAEVLWALGHASESRKLLEDVLRRLEGLGLGDSPGAVRIRDAVASQAAQGGEAAQGMALGATDSEEGEGIRIGDAHAPTDARAASGSGALSALQALRDLVQGSLSESGESDDETLLQLGDFAFADGDLDAADQHYRDLLDRHPGGDFAEPVRLRAAMGRARIADARGQLGQNQDLAAAVAEAARAQWPPDHPFVLEAQDRQVRAAQGAQYGEELAKLLETILADQESQLNPDHSAVQATRRVLAAEYARQEDLPRALELLREALESLARTRASDDPTLAETRLELVALLDRMGAHGAALEIGPGSDPAGVHAESAASPSGATSLAALRQRARELQSSCRLAEAIDLYRQIVQQQRGDPSLDPSERVEGLRDLAAVQRVLGSTDDASLLEAEADFIAQSAPKDLGRLSEWIERTRSSLESNRGTPRVSLRVTSVAEAPPRRVLAEIQDPAGILAVHVLQDGIPLSPELDKDAWDLDADGTHARLTLTLPPVGQPQPTVISVAVENLAHARSPYESVVLTD